MSKIRALSDHVINQIAAGEVVERPASVAKELVENAIDAGARRVEVDVEAGGRRLLRVADDGEGMTRDDAVLAFERHATSKIHATEDLERISTLGFRGEALASIASVARVELVTCTEGQAEGTRVQIEGGRMRDVGPAARPRGTTVAVRDLFFNVPARRKFLRSEATESFHLANLVTHYALAHPEIAFALTNNGREVLRADPAADLRERAYQIFGAEFIENLLELGGGPAGVARVRGYVSAPRERRTSRDAQFLFVNGRYVRDRLVARALGEGYRSVLPQGTYPAALLFLEAPPEEVDVNVHPAKTEVRFRRVSAVADAVRDAVRAALARGGFLTLAAHAHEPDDSVRDASEESFRTYHSDPWGAPETPTRVASDETAFEGGDAARGFDAGPRQEAIEFGPTPPAEDHSFLRENQSFAVDEEDAALRDEGASPDDVGAKPRAAVRGGESHGGGTAAPTEESVGRAGATARAGRPAVRAARGSEGDSAGASASTGAVSRAEAGAGAASHAEADASAPRAASLPPVGSLAGLVREADAESLSSNIRPLGQLGESFIVATDHEGLLLIDQHVAHERILFDKYRALEDTRRADSQSLLLPETFDLTPAQAAAFDAVSGELERYGFELMRLSGRTVAIRAVPADLPAGEARGLLSEILDTVETDRRGRARAALRDEIAATLASRAAVKSNTPLTQEKMRWLVERLLTTSSPTTGPHGRPAILRLARRDIERGFHRP
jgi:DNA mismatch repair protein MutL